MRKNIRTIVVNSLNWFREVQLDSTLFKDLYMEAATRVIEQNKDNPKFQLSPVMICFDKKDVNNVDKYYLYNTYYILINAGLHKKAEAFREIILKMHSFDIGEEKLMENNKQNNFLTGSIYK